MDMWDRLSELLVNSFKW